MQLNDTNLTAQRPIWTENNLAYLLRYFRVMKAVVGSSIAIVPAVKSNAYAHIAIECALAIESAGAVWMRH
jgi:alanine racemase